ncbi:flagellar protein FliT [Pseudomonadota bacterium]
MAEADRLLEQLLDKSKCLRALAEKSEWEAAATLEQERRSLIESCFSPGVTFDAPQLAATKIQEILDLDKQVLDMGAKARKEAGEALGGIQRGHQALQAYQKAGA